MNGERESPGNRRGGQSSRRGFLKLLGGAAVGIAAVPVIAACNTAPRNVVAMTSQQKFEPATLTIKKGGTVTWANIAGQGYAVVLDPSKQTEGPGASLPQGAQPFTSPNIYPGQDWAHRFTTVGRYVYYAAQYPQQMVGTIMVTER